MLEAIDISFSNPQDNLLFDEVLLDIAEHTGVETLRFWEAPNLFVVLGRICKIEDDLNAEMLKKNNIAVYRRCSGGGTVIQGQGCLNYTFVLSKEKRKEINDLRQSYQYILNHVISALTRINIQAQFFPISDLALFSNQKKFSGNAQKRGRTFILHHGTILYNFDLKSIAQYLKMPKSVPDYRQGRSHLDFVTNIAIDPQAFKRELLNIFDISNARTQINEQERKGLSTFSSQKNLQEIL